MSAVLTLAVGLLAGMAFMTAVSRVVPWLTRLVAVVILVPSGWFVVGRLPGRWVVGAVVVLLVFAVVQAVAESPSWSRRVHSLASRVGRRVRAHAARAGHVLGRVAAWLLTWRRPWAEALAGIALEAMAGTCESCERGPATMTVEFPDGEIFHVCGPCAARGYPHGARSIRSAS